MFRAFVVVSAFSVSLLGCGDPVGNTACIGVTVQRDMTTCLTTLSRCDDGRGYDVVCNAGKCTCNVDGKVVSSAKATDCPDDPKSVNAACAWEIQ